MTEDTVYELKTNDKKYFVAAAFPGAQQRIDRRSVVRESGCIEWTGALSRAGYGVLTVNKQLVYAHRLAYFITYGGIAVGDAIDHLCHNRACVNTSHMQHVSLRMNSSRTPRAFQTCCLRGHEFNEENTRICYDARDRPHRICIQCTNARNAVRRQVAFSS